MLSRWLVVLVLALLLPSYGAAAPERPAVSAAVDIERVVDTTAAADPASAAAIAAPDVAPMPPIDAESCADGAFDLAEACGPPPPRAAAPAAAPAPRGPAPRGLPSPDLAGPLRPPKFAA